MKSIMYFIMFCCIFCCSSVGSGMIIFCWKNMNVTAMTGLAGASTVNLSSQDGQPSGTLQSFAIGPDGSVSAFFSGGENVAHHLVHVGGDDFYANGQGQKGGSAQR